MHRFAQIGAAILLALLSVLPAQAQWQVPSGTVPIGRGPGVQGFYSSPQGTFNNNVVSPLAFGAVGDGSSHTAGTALKITTLAGLVGYTDAQGRRPYSWAGTYPYGNLFNLPVSAAASAGATSLTFGQTQTAGLQFPTTTTVASGSTLVFAGTWDIAVGTQVTGTNIAGSTTVSTVTQTTSTTITLSNAITGPISSGSVIGFGVGAVSSGYVIDVLDMTGVYQGMTVSGVGVPANTYVEDVNPSSLKIRTNNATTVASGATLTFTQPLLPSVQVGWAVTGPGIPSSTTVASVSGNVIGLSAAITATLSPVTPNTAGTPANHGTPVTFYSPWTDIQAVSLQMDTLGIIAAEQLVENGGGGTVAIPVGTFKMDFPLVVPVFAETNPGIGAVNVVGQGQYQTILEPDYDLGGFGNSIFSCGDPSGMQDNKRGVYAYNGSFCWGQLTDIQFFNPGTTSKYGNRPYIGTSPVYMNGLNVGARREMHNVNYWGFNVGLLFAGDHTGFYFINGAHNYINFEYGPITTNLFLDLNFDHPSFSTGGLADIAIAPDEQFKAQMDSPYIGYAPYGFYCMPGLPTVTACITGTIINSTNSEDAGCAAIFDGNLQPSVTSQGGRKSVYNSTWLSPFFSRGTAQQPLGGCTWNAFFDMYGLVGVTFTDLTQSNFSVVSGAVGIVRAYRLDGFGHSIGGVTFQGYAVTPLSTALAAACQDWAAGGGGVGATFDYTNSNDLIALVDPGVYTAREVRWYDSSATSLIAGEIGEGVSTGRGLGARRGGTALAGTAPIMGTSLVPWAACDPNAHYPVFVVSGRQVPVAVSASNNYGTLLKMPATATGIAIAATSVTDGQTVGAVDNTNGGSTSLEYIQTMFPSGAP